LRPFGSDSENALVEMRFEALRRMRTFQSLPSLVALVLVLSAVAGGVLVLGAEPASPDGGSGPIEFSDLFTSGPAPLPTGDLMPGESAPAEAAARPLSREGAAVLLRDARHLLETGRVAAGRALLFDVVSRMGGEPPAPEAVVLLVQSADSPEQARQHLLQFTFLPQGPFDGEAARLATEWAEKASREGPKGQVNPEILELWNLAADLALRSDHPSRVREALEGRARYALRSGRPEEALEVLRAAESRGQVKDLDAPWMGLSAEAALALGRFGEARERLGRLIERFPAAPEARAAQGRLGLLFELEGQPDQALRSYGRFLAETPEKQGDSWVSARWRSLSVPFFPPPGGSPPVK
jgi:tetratricopeptide (TPR) repeat protein